MAGSVASPSASSVRVQDDKGPLVLSAWPTSYEGAVNVLSFRDGRIDWIAAFLDPEVLPRFGLPAEL